MHKDGGPKHRNKDNEKFSCVPSWFQMLKNHKKFFQSITKNSGASLIPCDGNCETFWALFEPIWWLILSINAIKRWTTSAFWTLKKNCVAKKILMILNVLFESNKMHPLSWNGFQKKLANFAWGSQMNRYMELFFSCNPGPSCDQQPPTGTE